jgi:hypothetical protein
VDEKKNTPASLSITQETWDALNQTDRDAISTAIIGLRSKWGDAVINGLDAGFRFPDEAA